MKYIIVTGGVVSGLGKGVTISSMGRLLQACGLKVTAIKIDPYLNVDAGTMSPYEHGETFVLDDGGETDLDLGNYERFLNLQLTSDHNITTGKIYREVIFQERRGDYLGKTVQVVPHITDAIQDWLERVAKIPVQRGDTETVADVCLIEVGGTVGDIESSVFLEALRQFQFRVGHDNFLLCFVSLVPVLSEEQKTKPTQHGVKDLRSLGLSPQIIFCRCPSSLMDSPKQKISNFCHVPIDSVLSVHDVSNVYHVPLLLQSQNLHQLISKALQLELPSPTPVLGEWAVMAHALETFERRVKIALIGKYTGLQDSYLSVLKALKHASIAVEVALDIEWIEATKLEKKAGNDGEAVLDEESAAAWDILKSADGVVVPGGFGNRGFEGKVQAAHYCRTTGKPYLGICLGFQAQVVEFSRYILGLTDANSTEFDADTTNKVVVFMPEVDKTTMGGTMRLGARPTTFTHPTHEDDGSTSVLYQLYGQQESVSERHRHRYEVNPEMVDTLHEAGLHLVGRDAETKTRMEIAELSRTTHPYYVGVQYHPEFQSRPLHPSPPFLGLILAATGGLDDHLTSQAFAKLK